MEGYTYNISVKTAYGIPFALSNCIDCSKGDGIYSIYEIMESANGDASRAAHLMNECNRVYDKYEPFRVMPDGFILRITDYCGNKMYMTVRKESK